MCRVAGDVFKCHPACHVIFSTSCVAPPGKNKRDKFVDNGYNGNNRSKIRQYTRNAATAPDLHLQLVTDIPLTVESIAVGNRKLATVVADVDAVMQMYIDLGQGNRDPYWTCVWPSSVAMAQELLQRPELVRGKRVADLGCGLGLGGVAAALSGASEVVFLDREPLALQCSLLNAALQTVPVVVDEETVEAAQALCTRNHAISHLLNGLRPNDPQLEYKDQTVARAELFDWSQPLSSSLAGAFDVVLACDVLYEAFSVEPVARISPQLLKLDQQGASLLLADPPLRAKHNRDRFLELLEGTDGSRRSDGESDGAVVVMEVVELGSRQARVWDQQDMDYKNVPIEFMILRKA